MPRRWRKIRRSANAWMRLAARADRCMVLFRMVDSVWMWIRLIQPLAHTYKTSCFNLLHGYNGNIQIDEALADWLVLCSRRGDRQFFECGGLSAAERHEFDLAAVALPGSANIASAGSIIFRLLPGLCCAGDAAIANGRFRRAILWWKASTACMFALLTAAEFTFKGINLPLREIPEGDVIYFRSEQFATVWICSITCCFYARCWARP